VVSCDLDISRSNSIVVFDTTAGLLGSIKRFDVVVAVGVVGSSSSLSSASSPMLLCTSIEGTFETLADTSSNALFSLYIAKASLSRLFS